MRAIVLHSPGRVEEQPLAGEEVPEPEPGRNELRIAVHACGVCHTDLHTVEGELGLPRHPVIPGHQVVGRVDKPGRRVKSFRAGERVGLGWVNRVCGVCKFCRNGRENLCEKARFTGLHLNGGYAEYAIAREDFAYLLPENVSDLHAAPLLCAGIIGYRALRLSGIKQGEKLGLYGFGSSAHLAIQVANHWDCETYVFTRSEEHRELARRLGAAWTGRAQETPPTKLDASITFAPVGWIVPLALEHLDRGATLAVNAIHMSDIPEMKYSHLYGERTLRSVTNFTRCDAVEFLRLAGEISVKAEVEEFPLSSANEVLSKLKQGKIGASAVLKI